MKKTKKTWKAENGQALSANNIDIHRAFQLKGKATIEAESARVEQGKTMADRFEKERGNKLPTKAEIAIKIEEVYYLHPGSEAGKKVS